MVTIDRLLAIRFARLGDVVLLLPALARLKLALPGSRVSLLTDQQCAPLGELCPYIDDVIAVNRILMRDGSRFRAAADILRLIRSLQEKRFDFAIDFHSFRETNLLTWLTKAPNRLGLKRYDRTYLPFCFNLPPVPEDKSLHVADMFDRVVGAVPGVNTSGERPTAVVRVPLEVQRCMAAKIPGGPMVALYVGASVPSRMWPAAHFAEAADFIISRFDVSVCIIPGRTQGEMAKQTRERMRLKHRAHVVEDLTIPELLAVLARSRLLVSNDTGPMHLGPVVGTPTLGIFSVSLPEHYSPLGPKSQYIRGTPVESVQVGDVVARIGQIWAGLNPDRRC